MSQHVVLIGGPLEAKRLIGPFPTENFAQSWLTRHPQRFAWVCPLESPEQGIAPPQAPAPAISSPVLDGEYGTHFLFGKYAGQTIASVAMHNPGYLVWAYETVGERSGVSDEAYTVACRKTGTQPRLRPPSTIERDAPVPPPLESPEYVDDDIPF